MARRKDLPILPSTPAPTLDMEALKANQLRRANAEVPEHIKRMSPAECRAECKRLAAQRPEYPGMDWAHRILSRIADGERVPLISEQMARAAISRTREPGDDDEEVKSWVA